MSYKPISLRSLISQKNITLFLPHIQRPFVWKPKQIAGLMDSLMRDYPIQTLLLWKTKEYIRTRKFMDNISDDAVLSDFYDMDKSQSGVEKTFVLDGQQRLQSLFTVFAGFIDDKEFYINLITGKEEIEEGLYYQFELSAKPLELPFFKIKGLVHDNRNADVISDEINDKLDEILDDHETVRDRQRLVRRNISQLTSLLREDKNFWYDELDGIAHDYPYSEILNIFIRVNSGGTKLDKADLMFAAMKRTWDEVEKNVENIADTLNNSESLHFDKEFILKCLMLIIDKGAELTPKLFLSEEGDKNLSKIKRNWQKISDTFEQLSDFINNDLKLYSEKVIRSYNAFAPIFEYLYYHPSPVPTNRQRLKSYYYKAQIFNWFSARTDQLLNAMHGILKNATGFDFPMKEINNYFYDQKKLIKIIKNDLKESRLRYIILNLLYVEFNGVSPFSVAYRQNEPHIDHIFPKSKLHHLETSDVNHIGNYCFIGASDNIKKRAELPDSYFSRLKDSGIDIKRHLLVDEYSDDPSKLTINNYLDFRDKRLEAIYQICSSIINKE